MRRTSRGPYEAVDIDFPPSDRLMLIHTVHTCTGKKPASKTENSSQFSCFKHMYTDADELVIYLYLVHVSV